MKYDFQTAAKRQCIGNMKGSLERGLPEQAVLLSGAEMDFPTAPCIREALSNFAQNGLYGFTLADAPYRQSICRWMEQIRDWKITEDDIVPTMGTVAGLCNAMRAFTKPGDGVILQHPSYYRFDRAVTRNGRRVVSNPMTEHDGRYELDFEDLERKMADPCNTMLVLCNPHNPTGKVFLEQDLRKIAALAERYGILVFSDEIFAETADVDHPVVPFGSLMAKSMTSTSLGKAFNFTGVNHANAIIPDLMLREAFLRQQETDHFGSLDPFFYNALLAAYTEEGCQWLQEMKKHVRGNYVCLQQGLARFSTVRLSPLEGTFVAWMDCRGLGMNDQQLQTFMEEQAFLYADPGEEYGPGGSGFYRINLAVTKASMEQVVRNLSAALDHL